MACPGEPPLRGKQLGDISYTRRVKGDFVINFVAMATGIGRGRICLISFDSPPTNTPSRHKRHRDIFYTRGVIACFVSNFVSPDPSPCGEGTLLPYTHSPPRRLRRLDPHAEILGTPLRRDAPREERCWIGRWCSHRLSVQTTVFRHSLAAICDVSVGDGEPPLWGVLVVGG